MFQYMTSKQYDQATNKSVNYLQNLCNKLKNQTELIIKFKCFPISLDITSTQQTQIFFSPIIQILKQ